jgi:hypothetical protein
MKQAGHPLTRFHMALPSIYSKTQIFLIEWHGMHKAVSWIQKAESMDPMSLKRSSQEYCSRTLCHIYVWLTGKTSHMVKI